MENSDLHYDTVLLLAIDKGMKRPKVIVQNELFVLTLIQKWLREEKKKIVLVQFSETFGWWNSISGVKRAFEYWVSYEDALKEGLFTTLKNL